MPALPGTRIRDNGVFGNITDNPLLIGASTFNSPDLADLSVVLGDHAIVTLDPLKEFGDPEIVMVTAHTAAATVATIQRGMYGTTPRQHPQNTLWVHAATTDDYTEIVTSVTRPADFYAGQRIFEIDTGLYVHRDQANSAWVPEVPTIQVFTSGGTWNKPAGLKAVKVRLVGGGGGGGGTAATGVGQAAMSSGGAGGGYAEKTIPASALGATETVTVGAGGTAGAAGNNNGGAGGNSSFGAHVTGGGGIQGLGSPATAGSQRIQGGAGSAASSGGDIEIAGSAGHWGLVVTLIHISDHGGGSALAPNQRTSIVIPSAGSSGGQYGGGGTGAQAAASQAAQPGGAGGAGVVIVEHYF